ncbi:hypothetical protein CMTB2_00914 [Caminibacter mediatlanticus TB-2]|uniref:Uncharacterized protein n=1 Tax=Caminibacter mediatlanticus TB-2 TaxID=391592 RepID=A0AAI9AHW2_9BACT|nr:hypothetical protein CMTB2_00914 [Caminibacter mediatlanticus TB-2]
MIKSIKIMRVLNIFKVTNLFKIGIILN